MKMIMKGIGATFAAITRQHNTLSEKEFRSRIASMLLMLKASTPKDTGFAQSEWQATGQFPRLRVLNNASYIEYLNRGSSKQAPAFFVESIALRFGKPYGLVAETIPSSPGSK